LDKKVSIYDIARLADCSTTTVYKVVNGRGGVGAETTKRVQDIIQKHGYKANTIAQMLARGQLRIGIVIENYSLEFNDEVLQGIREEMNSLSDANVVAVYGSMESKYSKERVINDLKEIGGGGVNGVILFPYEPYLEYTEVIDALTQNHIPVILSTTDIPGSSRIALVSHNYHVVGRLGAELLNVFAPGGKKALFVGSKDVIGHQHIISGFETHLALSGQRPAVVYETQEDEQVGYYLTGKLLRDCPDISGIFVGTSHSLGVCRSIVESGLTGKVSIVCVDTHPGLMEQIKNGVIQATLYQNPKLQGRITVRSLVNYIVEGRKPADHVLVNPVVVMRSNMEHFENDQNLGLWR